MCDSNSQAVCWPLFDVVVAMPGSLHLSRLQAAALLALGLPPVLLLGLHSKYLRLQGKGGATIWTYCSRQPTWQYLNTKLEGYVNMHRTCIAYLDIYTFNVQMDIFWCQVNFHIFNIEVYRFDILYIYIYAYVCVCMCIYIYLNVYVYVCFSLSVSFFPHRYLAVYGPNVSFYMCMGLSTSRFLLPSPCPWSGQFWLCGSFLQLFLAGGFLWGSAGHDSVFCQRWLWLINP